MKHASIAIRIVLTAGMTVMVWREAGPWTGTAIGLISLSIELQARHNRVVMAIIRVLAGETRRFKP